MDGIHLKNNLYIDQKMHIKLKYYQRKLNIKKKKKLRLIDLVLVYIMLIFKEKKFKKYFYYNI